ncbi:MAG UNVERIFIED_CONTAM: 3'-5' exonuclease [Planctomycetaceae bacterium]|jgi:hypothetical protein
MAHRLQNLYHEGKTDLINDYCRCDVLDTYFVFLRTQVLLGRISSQEERDLTSSARELLQSQAADHPAYQHYLKTWDERLQQQHDIPAALGANTCNCGHRKQNRSRRSTEHPASAAGEKHRRKHRELTKTDKGGNSSTSTSLEHEERDEYQSRTFVVQLHPTPRLSVPIRVHPWQERNSPQTSVAHFAASRETNSLQLNRRSTELGLESPSYINGSPADSRPRLA